MNEAWLSFTCLSRLLPSVSDLSYNFISTFNTSTFANLTHLNELRLISNMITALPPFVDGLSSLKALSLHGNFLTSLNPPFFFSLPSLVYLDISDNFIMDISSAPLWLPLLSTLVVRNNTITTIEGALQYLPSLTELDLSYNIITLLTNATFSSSTGLTLLNLGSNYICSISPDTFASLTSLLSLDLSSNPSLPPLFPGMFNGLAFLQQLILSFSNVTSIPVGLFDGAFTVTAKYVPWQTWYYSSPSHSFELLQQMPTL